MNTVVKSFREFRALKLKLANEVEVTRIGSHYRARFRGKTSSVFGASIEEAKHKLLNSPSFWSDHYKVFEDR